MFGLYAIVKWCKNKSNQHRKDPMQWLYTASVTLPTRPRAHHLSSTSRHDRKKGWGPWNPLNGKPLDFEK
eukprot:4977646-Amphidinium_carterae.1